MEQGIENNIPQAGKSKGAICVPLDRSRLCFLEVDFIATKADEKIYIQVTESMEREEVRRRGLAPFRSIRDNYEKLVLSLNPGLDVSANGVYPKFCVNSKTEVADKNEFVAVAAPAAIAFSPP